MFGFFRFFFIFSRARAGRESAPPLISFRRCSLTIGCLAAFVGEALAACRPLFFFVSFCFGCLLAFVFAFLFCRPLFFFGFFSFWLLAGFCFLLFLLSTFVFLVSFCFGCLMAFVFCLSLLWLRVGIVSVFGCLSAFALLLSLIIVATCWPFFVF